LTHPPPQGLYPLAHPQAPEVQTMFVPQDVLFAATGLVQVPVPAWHVPARWHASLAGHDDDAQHTLFTQLVAAAQVVEPAVHAWPWGAVDWHLPVPLLQYGVAAAHCESRVQTVKQDPPLHANPLHPCVVCVLQAPAPLQPAASITVPPEQLCEAQEVPDPG
jgi:hypothetical protein